MNLKFDIKTSEVLKEVKEKVLERLKKDVEAAAQKLGKAAYKKAQDISREKLPDSLNSIYQENLYIEQVADNITVIGVREEALWIEEGRKCVVYGNNKDHIPKVLTPDGEIPITQLKVGMLVLNQYGKWTDVVEIYDEHLVERSKLKIHEIKACRYEPKNKKLHKREYSLGFSTICPVCKGKKIYKKINCKTRNNLYCTRCLEKEEVYKVEVSGHLNTNSSSKNWSTMYLTGDHKVMTQEGWKEIKDFKKQVDCLKVPSWNECKVCKKDTFFGNDFCYDKEGGRCSSSFFVNETLKKGSHQCQKPDHRAKYLKILKKIHKGNKTEQKLEDLIKKTHSCIPWDKNKKTDFFREYPVKVRSDGKYKDKYYYLDFYSPSLNLAIEVDGKAFHCKVRDSKRDRLIKEKLKCDIIRIPANNVWKKNFYKKTLLPIIKNHTDEIKMLNFNAVRVTRKYLKKSSPINRRWDITVREGESFVCNKILIHNSGFMDELLKNAKTSKDGKRYKVIPFKHETSNKGSTGSGSDLVAELKTFLRSKNQPYSKTRSLEVDSKGSPRVGKIASFGIKDMAKQSKNLQGLSIYQNKNPKTGQVERNIMTFRVISEKHRDEGKWNHPGRPAEKILDDTFEYIQKSWQQEILPALKEKYKK